MLVLDQPLNENPGGGTVLGKPDPFSPQIGRLADLRFWPNADTVVPEYLRKHHWDGHERAPVPSF